MKYIIDLPDKDKSKYTLSGKLSIPIQVGNNEFTIDIDTGLELKPYDEFGRSEDGWNLARAIRKMDDPDIEEAFSVSGWTRPIDGVLEMIEYAEAKAKHDAWKKRKDELKIGDEVMHDTYRRCVLLEKKDIHEVELWSVIDEKGTVHQINGKHINRKTGRHFNEIAELIEKMKEPEG